MSSHLRIITDALTKINALKGDMTGLVIKTDDGLIGEIQILINQLILNLNRNYMNIFETATVIIEQNAREKESVLELFRTNEETNRSNEEMNNEIQRQIDSARNTSAVLKQMIESIRSNIAKSEQQSALISDTETSVLKMDESIRRSPKRPKGASTATALPSPDEGAERSFP
jgi:methyl-accepting chemotaxis protein